MASHYYGYAVVIHETKAYLHNLRIYVRIQHEAIASFSSVQNQ